MDCEGCGRYRSSEEIAVTVSVGGRLAMACMRCRRVAGHPPSRTVAPARVVGPRPG
jgi:hypothetical protein